MRYTQSSVINETQLPVMSIGAPAFAVDGGAAGAARRCCASAGLKSAVLVIKLKTTASNKRSTRFMSISAD